MTYSIPEREPTKCSFDESRELVVCEDGTESEMVTTGLPFVGVVSVRFDGRVFATDEFSANRR